MDDSSTPLKKNSSSKNGLKLKIGIRKILVTKLSSQLAITCSKLTIETQEQGVKYDQS